MNLVHYFCQQLLGVILIIFTIFFPYEETDKKFSIPYDLNILKEIFMINNGSYNKSNYYWKSFSIQNEINNLNLNIKI